MTAPDQFLAASRREFSVAKRWKAFQWRVDISASLVALTASAVPVPSLSLALVVLAAASKIGARFAQWRSRSCFRVAERARRYDFQRRALGWELPHDEYADIVLSLSGESGALPVADADRLQTGYFEYEGAPGVERLLTNLHESVFWSRRLFAEMAQRRGWHLFWAVTAVLTAALAALFVPWQDGRWIAVRVVAVAVTVFVSLDVFGEWAAFGRSSSQLAVVEKVLVELRMRGATPAKALRFLIDYSCLLVDAPLVPDEVYEELRPELDQLWTLGRSTVDHSVAGRDVAPLGAVPTPGRAVARSGSGDGRGTP
jgi:hypothetical protein